MILIINLSTKFSTPQTLLRLKQNAKTFYFKRPCVLSEMPLRFQANAKAFFYVRFFTDTRNA